MTNFMRLRLALTGIGVVVWGYGLVRDEPTVRLVGIIVLAASLLLRFAPKALRDGAEQPKGPDQPPS
jgi:hypothetical protein